MESRLQINEFGSWRNVSEFDVAGVETVKSAVVVLSAALPGRKFRLQTQLDGRWMATQMLNGSSWAAIIHHGCQS